MFKPQLAPNEKIDLTTLTYPLLASYKIDGIRAIFMNGEMYSRSLKQLPNKQLALRFDVLKKFSKDNNCILDGELWARSVTFPELSGIIRQLDCVLPDDLNFYCFDMIKDNNFNEPFKNRVDNINYLRNEGIKFFNIVDQWAVHSAKEVENLFQNALGNRFEGLILRNPSGHYKCGRGTVKVTLAMTDVEKEEVWKNWTNYIGKTIEWKGMLVGAKDVPRHPVFIRFREDK